jgi:hypothetical protein
LTNRAIDAELFYRNERKNRINQNRVVYNSLVHSLPYLHSINLKTLMSVREKEGESFETYRTSLSKFLINIQNIEQSELIEAFNDEILPELNKIKLTIKKSKKLIFADMSKDLVLGSTIVTIGLLTNLLPANIAQILTTIGGVNYADKFASNIKKLATVESEVKDNKYYFLWKLQRM